MCGLSTVRSASAYRAAFPGEPSSSSERMSTDSGVPGRRKPRLCVSVRGAVSARRIVAGSSGVLRS